MYRDLEDPFFRNGTFIFSIVFNNRLSRIGNDPFLVKSDNLIASNVAIKGAPIFEGIFKFIKSINFGRIARLHVEHFLGMTVVSVKIETGQAATFHAIGGAAAEGTAPAIGCLELRHFDLDILKVGIFPRRNLVGTSVDLARI